MWGRYPLVEMAISGRLDARLSDAWDEGAMIAER